MCLGRVWGAVNHLAMLCRGCYISLALNQSWYICTEASSVQHFRALPVSICVFLPFANFLPTSLPRYCWISCSFFSSLSSIELISLPLWVSLLAEINKGLLTFCGVYSEDPGTSRQVPKHVMSFANKGLNELRH